MSWNYSGNPANSDLDKYRFLITDIDPSDKLLQDEEIQFILDTYPSNTVRLYELFQRIADMLGRAIKQSLGPQSEDPTGRTQYFERRAKEYKDLSKAGITVPKYAANKAFTKGMHNNV